MSEIVGDLPLVFQQPSINFVPRSRSSFIGLVRSQQAPHLSDATASKGQDWLVGVPCTASKCSRVSSCWRQSQVHHPHLPGTEKDFETSLPPPASLLGWLHRRGSIFLCGATWEQRPTHTLYFCRCMIRVGQRSAERNAKGSKHKRKQQERLLVPATSRRRPSTSRAANQAKSRITLALVTGPLP